LTTSIGAKLVLEACHGVGGQIQDAHAHLIRPNVDAPFDDVDAGPADRVAASCDLIADLFECGHVVCLFAADPDAQLRRDGLPNLADQTSKPKIVAGREHLEDPVWPERQSRIQRLFLRAEPGFQRPR
jgi:hypothetical protein